MAVNAKEYREHLYRLRTHPHAIQDDFRDKRNSFVPLYISLMPFLVGEYLAESTYDYMPSGLVFPLAFILFWAFYYTYYKPGFLEDRLTSPQKWDLIGIPTVLIGVVIWFVKVTVVELTHLFIKAVFGVKKPEAKPKQAPPRPAPHQTHFHQQERPKQQQQQQRAHTSDTYHRPNHYSNTEGTRFYKAPPKPPPSKMALPRDILQALTILGLTETADWNQIHRRYRELAKQFHPDLNHDITEVGRRFMTYDAAYRKLASVKIRYFPEKRANG